MIVDENFENVTWQDVDDFISMVCDKLKSDSSININKISGVYGLPRGGLVFAVMLSHALDIPLLAAPADKCIIVDDICDSGESLLHYVKNSSGHNSRKHITVTMYLKPNQLVKPDIYAKIKGDKWIVFPWEYLH